MNERKFKRNNYFIFFYLLITILLGDYSMSMNSLKYLQDQVPKDTACWIMAIGRGKGRVDKDEITCLEKEEYTNGKCYQICPNDFVGTGSICWGKCKDEYKECGAICLKNQTCSGVIKEYVENIKNKVENYVEENNFLGEIEMENFSDEFTFPKCQ